MIRNDSSRIEWIKGDGWAYLETAIGMLAPIPILIFDQLFFNPPPGFSTVLSRNWVFVVIGIIFGGLSLFIRLIFQKRYQIPNSFVTGIFLAGLSFEFVIALLYLPFAVIFGLNLLPDEYRKGLWGIGLLVIAYLPFQIAITCYLALHWTYKHLHSRPITMRSWAIVLAGILVVILIPLTFQRAADGYLSAAIHRILTGDSAEVSEGIALIENAFWCNKSCFDGLINAYRDPDDPRRLPIISEAYQQLTGEDIEIRIQIIEDSEN